MAAKKGETNQFQEHTRELRKDAMLQALRKTLGIVTSALKASGVTRTTFYGWMDKDPDFRDAVQSIENEALDFVESKLYQQINDNNTTATIFYLKTKGRKRGYGEVTETIVKAEKPRQIMIIGGQEIEF